MNIRKIIEEFEEMVKQGKATFSIHKNPGTKEIKEILKEAKEIAQENGYEIDAASMAVRFIADLNKKNLYVFSALLLHEKAAKKLGIPYRGTFDYVFDAGYVNKDGKIVIPSKLKNKLKNEGFKNLERAFL